MPSFHQSSAACRDSLVICLHTLYACGMSAAIRRERVLTSEIETTHAEDWQMDAETRSAKAARQNERRGARSKPTESVSRYVALRSACRSSKAARRGGR